MKKLGLCLLMILMSLPVLAATVVSDPFTDGGRTDGVDAQDVAWWKAYNSTTAFTLDVENDGVLGSSLHYKNVTTDVRRRAVANFTPQSLTNLGDKITLSLDFRLASLPPYVDTIRFGLFDAGSSLLTADTLSGGTATIVNGDVGYFTGLGAGALQSTLYEEKGTETLMGGTDQKNWDRVTDFGISDTLKHTASLILTLTSTGVSMDVVVDTVTVLTGVDTDGSVVTFNQIAIGGSTIYTALDIFVDNVKVDFTPIPEPATLSIFALGALAALRRKHRA
jgi:hypothetical protein